MHQTVGYLVGRFNPLQLGHKALLQHIYDQNDHMVVLIGSATESRTHKNPLTFEERKALIKSFFPNAVVLPLPDMPSDDEWVKLFESTIAVGIQSLQLPGAVHARMYSADATRADDYALRCEWVRNLGHEVVPFAPVMARTDLSASLVRDNWYNGRYKEMTELVPPETLELLQQLDIGWMRTAYVKRVDLGALGEKNSVFVAFVSPVGTDGAPVNLGYIVRWNGELGFVGGQVDAGESLEQALLREAYEEVGADLDPARLVPVCSHAMTGKGPTQHTHFYVYQVSRDELFALRQEALLAPHAQTEVAAFVVAHLTQEVPDILLQQKWAGTGKDELQTLIWAGHL